MKFFRVISGDGQIGWEKGSKATVQVSELIGQFAFSLKNFGSYIHIGAPSHEVAWGSLVTTSGDVLIGSVTANGTLSSDRLTLSSIILESRPSFFIPSASEFGSFSLSSESIFSVPSRVNGTVIVGARGHNGGGGTVWVFMFDRPGHISSVSEVSYPRTQSPQISLPTLDKADWANLGTSGFSFDIDGDRLDEVIIGAPGSRSRFLQTETGVWDFGGAVWILGFQAVTTSSIPTLRLRSSIDQSTFQSLNETLDAAAEFGYSIAAVSNNASNGFTLFVGAPGANSEQGLIFKISARRVSSQVVVSSIIEVLFPVAIAEGSRCGSSIEILPDFDRDFEPELLIGCTGQGTGFTLLASLANMDFDANDGASYRRARLTTFTKIDSSQIPSELSGFSASLNDGDEFGSSAMYLGDIDGDDVVEFAIGAPKRGSAVGASYVFSVPIPAFEASPEPKSGGGSSVGVPAWIVGPILGALALPAALLMRRKSKAGRAKLLTLTEPGVLPTLPVVLEHSETLPVSSALDDEYLAALFVDSVAPTPDVLAMELLRAVFDLSIQNLNDSLVMSVSRDKPLTLLEQELFDATQRVTIGENWMPTRSIPKELIQAAGCADPNELEELLAEALMNPSAALRERIIPAELLGASHAELTFEESAEFLSEYMAKLSQGSPSRHPMALGQSHDDSPTPPPNFG